MYSVNMIDLQSSEYEELKMLVEAEAEGGDACSVATARLEGYDDRIHEVYRGLSRVGLIQGFDLANCFVFHKLNQSGIDFVRDYAASVSEDRRRTAEQRRHDYKVASYGAVAGGILGLFSGALASYLLPAVIGLLTGLSQVQ